MFFRYLSSYVTTLIVGLLVIVFIAIPFGSVLVESFSVSGPLPLPELRAMTLDALERLDSESRDKMVKRWVERAKPRQRMEAIAAGLELLGQRVPWDRKAAFDEQIEAAERTVGTLEPEAQKKLEELYPISFVMLHKRIPLAFKLKNQLSKKEFDVLRLGTREGYGFRHYLSLFIEERLQNGAKNSLMLAVIASFATTFIAFAISYGINR
ncbi:MAG: hypothetical protein GTO40_09000, partial [Deltaproteobacteria bacterium]|nr:hypothetical protein [Deltaproteobacteria bacterium]